MRIVGPGPSRGRGVVSPNSLEGEASRARIATPAIAAGMGPRRRATLLASGLAAALLLAALVLSASAGASHTPDGIVALGDGNEEEEWYPPEEEEEEVPGDEVDIGPPPDDDVDLGGDPPDEFPTYDLFLEPGMPLVTREGSVLELGDPRLRTGEGIFWLPLVRPFGNAFVRVRLGLARLVRGGDLIWVKSDRHSQRDSLPTTLGFTSWAPMRLFDLHDDDLPRRYGGDLQIRFSAHWEDCPATRAVSIGFHGECDVHPLGPGGSGSVYGEWEWDVTERHHGRTIAFTWLLRCQPPHESDCSNNMLRGKFGFSFPPGTKIAGIGEVRFWGDAGGPATEAGGSRANRSARSAVPSAQRRPRRTVKRADRPARVEIALVKLAKRQRGFSGAVPAELAPDPTQAAGNGARQCSWLANRKREFKQVPAGENSVCDNPVWLRAKLNKPRKKAKRSRWRYRWKKRLRPGRYVLYSRATTRRGMPEMVFKKGRGNRVEFRVKKRR